MTESTLHNFVGEAMSFDENWRRQIWKSLRELDAEDPECFRKIHRLDRQSFYSILVLVGLYIVKNNANMRDSIGLGGRISVTLQFLASDASLLYLAYLISRRNDHAYSTSHRFAHKVILPIFVLGLGNTSLLLERLLCSTIISFNRLSVFLLIQSLKIISMRFLYK